MNNTRALTPERARVLIDEREARLAAAGIRASIRISGGAAMALRFPDDPDVRVTLDVDTASELRPRSTASSPIWQPSTGFQTGG